MESIATELEGTLLKDKDTFSYLMLVAFEASGVFRFAFLLFFWPIIRLLDASGKTNASLKLAIFVATAGVRLTEIESVARAVLPKFYMDDLNLEAWREFNSGDRRVVKTKLPRVMAEWFATEHLHADGVIGGEFVVNRFGFATGFVREGDGSSTICGHSGSFRPVRKGQMKCMLHNTCKKHNNYKSICPPPVIFHDGRLVRRPTPFTSLVVLLWIPFGMILVFVRLCVGLASPLWAIPLVVPMMGGKVVVRGTPPPTPSTPNSGVLFVCTHRTLMDPTLLSMVLQRKIPAATYSLSRFSEIISPIPIVQLSRNRHIDAKKVKSVLSRGDLVVCPEGTTCREPFLLRFSALFAELTDRIVPVAINYRVEFFHATTARGWKGFDPIFFLMNPNGVYEVTFLDQLAKEETCSSGKMPQDVANYVQGILAATLGFECTDLTRKDKYRILTGKDGKVRSYDVSNPFATYQF